MTEKNRETVQDGYVLARAEAGDYPAMYALMREVYEGLTNREIFSVEDFEESWFDQQAALGGFGVTAKLDGELAGMLMVTIPGLTEENLGYDLGLPEAELMAVACMDVAAVAQRHRGHRLERRMLAFAEQALEGSPYRIFLCTVSPYNPASLKSVQSLGYEIALTKEKYGGVLRHILMKRTGQG